MYDFDNLRRLWIANGGPAEQADNAAAVALAESSGNPTARDPEHGTYPNGSYDSGLWQINGHQDLTDANANARVAVEMYTSRGWEPWCTAWTDGACGTKGGTPPTRTEVAYKSPAWYALHEHVTQPIPTQPYDWTGDVIVSLPTIGHGAGMPPKSPNQYVKNLQGLLIAHGADLHCDGRDGDDTTAAVKHYQTVSGLSDDGIVGEHTWSHLLGEPR